MHSAASPSSGNVQARLGMPAELLPPASAASLAHAANAGGGAVAGGAGAPPSSVGNPWSIVLAMPDAGTTFDELEKEILAQVLARADGNQSRAARSLGLSESTLRSRLKRLGLKGSPT
jgi:DNA-binding NtrC family response regulator